MVYSTKVHISDVYWLHIEGEEVITCSLEYEAIKEYIESHNSKARLANISIYKYGGMSDLAIYDSEFDEDFWKQPDDKNYIKISSFKKLVD